jgi:hypothetical protein
MTPDQALGKQIEIYRQMTGEQRLKIALDLHTFACDVAREGIRRQYPDANEMEVNRHLKHRIEMSRE